MSGSIFLIQGDRKLVPMTEHRYDSEDLLQQLLANYPGILAGDQMNRAAPRRWLLIDREVGVPGEEGGAARWSLDHLFVDQDAIPTLVEVKRSTDTRIRREVVGQLLDYAANAVVYWPPASIRAHFEATCLRQRTVPETLMETFLGPDGDGAEFWHEVERNLQAGRIRLVFVADQIPVELQRIVEFLNGQMSQAEVLAVEVRQYVDQDRGIKTLVPRVIGQTSAAQQQKDGATRPSRIWDESTFLSDLHGRHGADAVRIARRLIAWATEMGLQKSWGRGKQDGSFFPMMALPEGKRGKVSLFSVWTYGSVEVEFQYLQLSGPFTSEALRLELRDQLNAIAGVDIPVGSIEKRPTFPLEVLVDETNLTLFLRTFDWVVAQVRGHEPLTIP